MKYDQVLGKMQAALALLHEERRSGLATREASIAITHLETAMLWRNEDVQRNHKLDGDEMS